MKVLALFVLALALVVATVFAAEEPEVAKQKRAIAPGYGYTGYQGYNGYPYSGYGGYGYGAAPAAYGGYGGYGAYGGYPGAIGYPYGY